MEFTLFPSLPKELRLKIWGLAASIPRTVGIQYNMQYDKLEKRTIPRPNGWTSLDPSPVVLRVCQESREEGLRSYKLAFGSHFHESKIFFDFSIDTLRFGRGLGDDLLRHPEINPEASSYHLDLFLCGGRDGADDSEKVQSLVIDVNEEAYGRKSFCWDEIREFGKLTKLTILPWEEEELKDQ